MVRLKHPYIRQVLDYGEYQNRPFIVMEYLEGKDFRKLLKEGKRFTDDELLKWWKQAKSAIEFTHSQEVIHRDIKPSNIFLQENGDIKILDFGIAKVRQEIEKTQLALTRTGTVLGTVMYASPEQIKNPKSVTYKTDYYSLGMTFASLLNGKPVIDTTTISSEFELSTKIVQGDWEIGNVSAQWKRIVEMSTKIEVEERELEVSGKDTEVITSDKESKTVNTVKLPEINDFVIIVFAVLSLIIIAIFYS